MAVKLVVTSPFGDYARGDSITDPEKVAAVLAGDDKLSVVRVNLPDGEG